MSNNNCNNMAPTQANRCQCLTAKGTQCKNKRKSKRTKYCGIHKGCRKSKTSTKRVAKKSKKKSTKKKFSKKSVPTGYDEYDKADHLVQLKRGLTVKERNFLKRLMTKSMLLEVIQYRYGGEPRVYEGMSKKELVGELKFPR